MLRTPAIFFFILFLSDQLFKRMKDFLVFGCWMFLFSSLFIWTAFECVAIFNKLGLFC